MKIILAVSLGFGVLAACATMLEETPEQIAVREHTECVSYGLKIGQEAYATCRLTLAQIRAEARATRRANAQILLLESSKLLQSSQPTYGVIATSPPITSSNCTVTQQGFVPGPSPLAGRGLTSRRVVTMPRNIPSYQVTCY